MFNQDFYPTPDHIISMMTSGMSLSGNTVLEPSAGSGNIVDYLKGMGANVVACENDQRLKHIVAAKCTLLKDDFLSVTSEEISHINYIVMNPPFSRGSSHLLHAWRVAPAGAQIVCLLNEGTLKHAHGDTTRELKSVVESYGNITSLGEAFSQSERKTDVRVDMVRIFKPKAGDQEFDGFFMEEEPEEQGSYGIMKHSDIREIVGRFVTAVKLFEEQEAIAEKIEQICTPFKTGSFAFTMEYNNQVSTKDRFKIELQKKAWKSIFEKMKLDKYLTKGVMNNINAFCENQQKVPFTMKNIHLMIDIIVGTAKQNFEKALVEVIDNFTRHHDENRFGVKGWKTNAGHLLNKKFIMPYTVELNYHGGMGVKYNSTYVEHLDDLIKVLCNLTGTDYETIGSLHNRLGNSYRLVNESTGEFMMPTKKSDGNVVYPYSNRPDCYTLNESKKHFESIGIKTYVKDARVSRGEWFEYAFFECKGFKMGSMHVKFKDEKLWERLNREYARIKGQVLPEKL